MDLIIKAKAFELEALEYINRRAPEMYKGKKHGFYWAVHEARNAKETIDWKRISRVRLEDYFTGLSYKEQIPVVTHLTAEKEEYEDLAQMMKMQFELKRTVQMAYCIRNILKWAVLNYYQEDVVKESFFADKTIKIDAFSKLNTDEKLVVLYKELMEIKEEIKGGQLCRN